MARPPRPFTVAPSPEDRDRFWDKVDIKSDLECWLWLAGDNGNGYGVFRFGGERCYSHRVAWYLFYDKNPPLDALDHLCENTYCVNPRHLEPVTTSENTERIKTRFRTHCLSGHKFTFENTIFLSNGKKLCRICEKERRANKTDRRTETIDECKRGHDTSFPEAREKDGRCKECLKLQNAERREYKRQWKARKKAESRSEDWVNPSAPLGDDVLQRVFDLRAEGWSQERIAEELDISRSSVSRILKRGSKT